MFLFICLRELSQKRQTYASYLYIGVFLSYIKSIAVHLSNAEFSFVSLDKKRDITKLCIRDKRYFVVCIYFFIFSTVDLTI